MGPERAQRRPLHHGLRLCAHVGARELLDYGAGTGRLGTALTQYIKHPLTIYHYDPANPEWSSPPAPCRFVACIDVLEHIEPDRIDNVLDDLKRVTLEVGVFTVHTGQAVKTLPPGCRSPVR